VLAWIRDCGVFQFTTCEPLKFTTCERVKYRVCGLLDSVSSYSWTGKSEIFLWMLLFRPTFSIL